MSMSAPRSAGPRNVSLTCAIIGSVIITSGVSLVTRAEQQVVTIRLTPDPLIEAHIQGIESPERTLRVSIERSQDSRSKSQEVSVRGSISDAHVVRLLKSAMATDDAYWTGGSSWHISVVGDDRYARVNVSSYCGLLCGGGASIRMRSKTEHGCSSTRRINGSANCVTRIRPGGGH